jgi:hypothetical protein
MRPGTRAVGDQQPDSRSQHRRTIPGTQPHFYFENSGKLLIYLGSADCMPRNHSERVELLFPQKDPQHGKRVCMEILSSYLGDTRKARILGDDGSYSTPRAARNGHAFSARDHFMPLAASTGELQRNAILPRSVVVYTSKDVPSGSRNGEGDVTGQDSSNAAV